VRIPLSLIDQWRVHDSAPDMHENEMAFARDGRTVTFTSSDQEQWVHTIGQRQDGR